MDDGTKQNEVEANAGGSTGDIGAETGQTIGEHKGYTPNTGADSPGLARLRDAAATEMPKAAVVSLAQHDQLKGRVAGIETNVEDVAEKHSDLVAAGDQMQKDHQSFKAEVAEKFRAFEAMLHRHGIREQTEAEPTDQ